MFGAQRRRVRRDVLGVADGEGGLDCDRQDSAAGTERVPSWRSLSLVASASSGRVCSQKGGRCGDEGERKTAELKLQIVDPPLLFAFSSLSLASVECPSRSRIDPMVSLSQNLAGSQQCPGRSSSCKIPQKITGRRRAQLQSSFE